MTDKRRYKRAFRIACELLNGAYIYGVSADTLFEKIMESNGLVASWSYEEFILNNLDRFSDDDTVRENAILRLGW